VSVQVEHHVAVHVHQVVAQALLRVLVQVHGASVLVLAVARAQGLGGRAGDGRADADALGLTGDDDGVHGLSCAESGGEVSHGDAVEHRGEGRVIVQRARQREQGHAVEPRGGQPRERVAPRRDEILRPRMGGEDGEHVFDVGDGQRHGQRVGGLVADVFHHGHQGQRAGLAPGSRDIAEVRLGVGQNRRRDGLEACAAVGDEPDQGVFGRGIGELLLDAEDERAVGQIPFCQIRPRELDGHLAQALRPGPERRCGCVTNACARYTTHCRRAGSTVT
jgi:hypothetical protein